MGKEFNEEEEAYQEDRNPRVVSAQQGRWVGGEGVGRPCVCAQGRPWVLGVLHNDSKGKAKLIHSTDVYCAANTCLELLGAGNVEV